MFGKLALLNAPPGASISQSEAEAAANQVLLLHPIQLSRFLEEVWAARNSQIKWLTPANLEIPEVPQLGLERDPGIRGFLPQWISASPAPTTGNFELLFTPPGGAPEKTAPLGPGATDAEVKTALEGTAAKTNVAVTGGPLGQRPIGVRFLGPLASGQVAPLKVDQGFSLEANGQLVEPQVQSNQANYPPSLWDHLIYAYMIENTRVYEIFRRVLEEYAYGERLGVPEGAAQQWLRTTEQLFYSDAPPLQLYALTSSIRPDIRAVRRNAYQRMFGLDLNHGTDDNRPYPYPRASAANTEFSSKFEELLREVWRATENARNSAGKNDTDISMIANLARTIYDMLRVRRQENVGNLARDELFHVSTMGWFHLTLSFNTPIVRSLGAEATSPAERLQKIGDRVGLPAHSRSDSYFHLAGDMSLILREMEMGTFNNATNGVPALFQLEPNPSVFQAAMQGIITHWTIATGRDLKTARVSVAPTAPAPVRPTPRTIGRPPSENGRPKQVPEATAR
ncbi:MAG TPA: hypothetical protein VFU16_07065 [Solirubrobacterales bacterium]|nr:hypothetical protein [Solirubrobacterales bacterium]